MGESYIYILSNDSLKRDYLKIGFTEKTPNERAMSLSKSSSIPSNFKVEYKKIVNDKRAVETRIQLLLSKYRISKNKEFFKINLEKAVKAVEFASDYCLYHEKASPHISLHNDLITRKESIPMTANAYKLWMAMMCSTVGNTHMDRVVDFDLSLKYGFLRSENYASLVQKSRATANNIMKSFCLKYRELKFSIYSGDNENDVRVFDELIYHQEHCLWSFTEEYRRLFSNNILSHLR